jgi:hypothetical protein
MKLLIESVVIFFGTLMAAAVVALGEPAGADLAVIGAVTGSPTSEQRPGILERWSQVWGQGAGKPEPH